MKRKFRISPLVIFLILMIATCSILLSSCTRNGAEKKVEEDLESMRNIELDDELTTQLESVLGDEGKENFIKFRKLIGEFEVEILESKKSELEDDDSTIVTVRIRTYNFGREYLRTWTEYLTEKGEEDFNQTEFYELLMNNLGGLESKGYYADVDIVCIDPVEDGTWQTDVASNAALRNAILGGMPNEIASLAQ